MDSHLPFDADEPPDPEERALLAMISVGLDGGEGAGYESVDEFAPDFLLQLDSLPPAD